MPAITNWLDDQLDTQPPAAPLAVVQTAATLPGRIQKQLAVPAGYVAVVRAPDGSARVLPAGSHTLGSIAAWYSGQLGDTTYVLLPTSYALNVTTPRLADGSGRLLDVRLQLSLQLADAQRFDARLVQPAGKLTELALATAVAQTAAPTLAQALRPYGAAALDRPAAAERIGEAVGPVLAAQLGGWGLRLEAIDSLTLQPSEELLALAQRSAALEADLRAQAQDAARARLAERAEMAAYVRQLEADYDLPGLLGAAATAPTDAAAPPTPDDAPRLRDRLLAAVDRVRSGRLAGELAAARTAADLPAEPAAQPAPALPGWYRWLNYLRYALTIATLLIVTFDVVRMDRQDPTYTTRVVELLLKVAATAIGIGLTFALGARARRQQAAARREQPLPLLTAGDLTRADQLLRGQLATALTAVPETLRQARLHVYRNGATDVALAIRPLEQQARRVADRVAQVGQGVPAYLQGLTLTPRTLHALLTNDSALLAQAHSLSDNSHAILSAALAGSATSELLTPLAVALADFDHDFRARGRLPLAD